MRKLSLLLVFSLLIGLVVLPAQAELEQPVVKTTVKNIIEVDGYQFRDLNDNGTLDVYEDWRADVEDRITDLISQMTLKEKVVLLFHPCLAGNNGGGGFTATEQEMYEQNCPFETDNSSSFGYSVWWYINEWGATHFLDNSNGTPLEKIRLHNEIQKMCEETRLGIPMSFSCDRENNGWAGFTDSPHDAFGTANDPELAVELWTRYAEMMKAIGYQVVFHPYGNEIGAWNGEDPEYLAKMTELEIKAIESTGLQTTTKHFVARGGDSAFTNARSVAQTVDNWMVPWQAAINAGTRWIMTNCAPGLTNTVRVDYDKESLDYLRNTLGYDGIVLTDWNQMRNFGDSSTTSVTVEGIDLSTLTLEELYARMFELGVNQIGCQTLVHGDDPSVTLSMTGYPDAVIQAVEEGTLDISYIEASDRLVLREKFRSGVFENPYCEEDAFYSLDVSEEYLASPWEITDAAALARARNPETVELERRLQAESTVLVKNDNALLPLPAGTKIYFESTNTGVQTDYATALGEKTALAETMADANVVVIDLTVLNDAAEQLMEDAKDAGKPVVISLNHVDPTTATVAAADALLFLNYSFTPDHGTSLDGFTFRMEGCVFADLLFGEREPAGMIVKEIARDSDMDTWQWKDLAGDQGASDWVRLMLLATMKEDPSKAIPANWGDPLLQYRYGMRYGQEPAFEYDTLVLPAGLVDVVQQNFFGPSTVQKVAYAPAKSGEPFKASFLLWNHGADGIVTVTAYDGETPIAEKIMAVTGNSWRVVEMELTLEGAGEHTLRIGDLTATITVE